jgi:N-acetylmuramoyl-L-alanine amidase
MLSERGASSESAKWLEDIEKKSDLIGGAGELSILGTKGDVNLNNEVPFLAETLLDLSMNANRSKSDRLGRLVLSELKQVTPLHKKTVEKAGFVVLKRPDVPSILIEAGFISNPREAKRLTQLEHQEKLSKAIASGIERYFEQDPPVGSLLSSLSNTTKYRVVRGDTLSEISLRFGVNAASVKEINNLKSNRIKVGQLLVIPVTKR